MSTTTQLGAPVSQNATTLTGTPRVPLVELNGLTVRFGDRDILRGLTASLRGRAVGLLGPNGAGKSTLINTLLGFYKPLSGSAKVFGHDIHTDIRFIRSLVGYMPENDAFISKMSAVSFIQMMGELSGLPSRVALERAHEALFFVGLSEARYRAGNRPRAQAVDPRRTDERARSFGATADDPHDSGNSREPGNAHHFVFTPST